MALPSTGTLSMSQINVEIKRASTNTLSLNDATVRKLAGRTSGSISFGNLRGKKFEVKYVNTSNRTGASIFSLMGSPTTAGVYIFENTAVISAGTGSYALRTGTFPSGSTLKIINKGTIRGRGGKGGTYSGAAGAGGNALHLDMTTTLDNAGGTISGGGGGGAWRRGIYNSDSRYDYRAGGGGGAGVNGGAGGSTSIGSLGARNITRQAGAGSSTGGGVGAGINRTGQPETFYGGKGGARGTKGSAGSGTFYYTYTHTNGAVGAAGKAINKNGKSLTIINAGTRHGATS